MIEARENIDLVTMKRLGDLESSQRVYQEQKPDLPQQTSPTQTLVVPTGTATPESQAASRPAPPAPTISPLSALRLSLAAVFLLGLMLIAIRQRRKR